jgi:multisubunit Na+/H+ antiporter MnhB subunit
VDNVQWTTAGLWLAVVASGLYHGINPGMGWPLAVSAGLMGRGRRDVVVALAPLAAGHLLSMLVILLPFALMAALLDWQREIRIGASVTVIAFGVFRLVNRRHPRALARIRPTQLALWSFAIATAHGAGLMLLPIYLGLCSSEEPDIAHQASSILMAQNSVTAVLVSLAHSLAMVTVGGVIALLVYSWLGLKFLSRSWFNLDFVWAISLILIGFIGLLTA